MAVTKVNASSAAVIEQTPYLHLGPFSKVLATEVAGNNFIGEWCCLNRCAIGRYSALSYCSYAADTEIGRYTTIGSRVSIGAFTHPTDWLSIHEFQYRDISQIYGETIIEEGRNLLADRTRPTRIGNDVWIGDNAAVRRGVTVGDGAIVGLSAVVVSDVEPYTIVVGNPARPVRRRFDDATVKTLLDIRWWTLDMQELRGVDFRNLPSAINELRRRVAKGGAR